MSSIFKRVDARMMSSGHIVEMPSPFERAQQAFGEHAMKVVVPDSLSAIEGGDWEKLDGSDAVKRILLGIKWSDMPENLHEKTCLDFEDCTKLWGSVKNFPDKLVEFIHEYPNVDDQNMAVAFRAGIRSGKIRFNHETERFEMLEVNTDSMNDVTGLMWQVALANWEATRKELTTGQVLVMAKISLQALYGAAIHPDAGGYSSEQVNKLLAKVQMVLAELNQRRDDEGAHRLPAGQ